MRLNDVEIIKRLISKKPNERIVITPMIRAFEQIGPSSVDVRLGTKFMVVAHSDRQYYDPLMTEEEYEKWLKHLKLVNRYSTFSEPFVLHPWQFTLASTLEFISLPTDIVGRIDGRSSWARQGLVVHSTAGDIHPGSSGSVVFELMNYGPVPILLYPGLAIAQLTFEQLAGPAKESYRERPSSKYSHFRQSLWSGYQDDSVLAAMRQLKIRDEERSERATRRQPRRLREREESGIKHRFIGVSATGVARNLNWNPGVGDSAQPTAERQISAEFEESIRYFKNNHAKLLGQYEGQYVAILNNQVVDYDHDWEQLSERTFRSFGQRDIYMPYLTPKSEERRTLSRPKRSKND